MDSPGSVKLNQPQAVTLDHLPVEVGGGELNNIIASRVKGLDRQDQGAAQHSWRRRRRYKGFTLNGVRSNMFNYTVRGAEVSTDMTW